MEKKDIHPGLEYGYREAPRVRGDLHHVRVLERVRSQWRVEWINPNPGLVDYVKSANLIVPWKEHRVFLRDEAHWADLYAACADWPGLDHPVSRAVDLVLSATGETEVSVDNRGAVSGPPDAFERLATRARFEFSGDRPSFTDRHGERHLPFRAGLEFARAFAHTEPQAVVLEVDTEEREYEVDARLPGNAYLVHLLQEYRAHWALCRQWAGFDEALASRDAEIDRLRRVIDDLRYLLIRAAQDDLVARLDRMVRGR